MLLLWGKTNGDIKAITGVSGLPFKLVTANPNIKTIKDYTPSDRIAVPTVRQSIQAITLGIALQKAYADDKGQREAALQSGNDGPSRRADGAPQFSA